MILSGTPVRRMPPLTLGVGPPPQLNFSRNTLTCVEHLPGNSKSCPDDSEDVPDGSPGDVVRPIRTGQSLKSLPESINSGLQSLAQVKPGHLSGQLCLGPEELCTNTLGASSKGQAYHHHAAGNLWVIMGAEGG